MHLRTPCLLAVLCLGLGDPGSSTSLEETLASLRAERIAADVSFLASDDMRGRDTPSKELRVAARYLRARLERLGFEPGTPHGWLQEYELEQSRLGAPSRMELVRDGEVLPLEYGQDVFLANDAGCIDLDLVAPAVFCGPGERSDFRAADVEGAWAVCTDSDATDARRARHARAAGAVGLLIVADPERRTRPRDDVLQRVARRARDGFVRYPEDGGDEDDAFPLAVLSQEAGADLVETSAGTPPAVGETLSWRVHDVRAGGGPIEVENVVGLWRGRDPGLADQAILLSAHYDHVGMRGEEVMNGADDNASGTSGLLAVADALAVRGPLRRSVLLVWVSGEEKGLYGSRAFAESPPLPEGLRPVCDLNIDMIGRNRPDELYVTPSRAHEGYNGLVALLEELAPLEGFPELVPADEFYSRSDHAMFARLGIPVAFLHSGEHADYHQPTDTPDKIDADKVRRVARLVVRALEGLQEDELPFPPPEPNR